MSSVRPGPPRERGRKQKGGAPCYCYCYCYCYYCCYYYYYYHCYYHCFHYFELSRRSIGRIMREMLLCESCVPVRQDAMPKLDFSTLRTTFQNAQFIDVSRCFAAGVTCASRVRLKGCEGPFQSSEAIVMICYFGSNSFNSTPLA